MDIAANAAIGKAIYKTLQTRYQAAGLTVPNMNLDSLGKAVISSTKGLARHLRHRPADKTDPQFQFYWRVLSIMIWIAHFGLRDAHVAVEVVDHLRQDLLVSGIQSLNKQEAAALTREITKLAKQQQKPGTLGAVGDALYYNILRHLSPLPPSKQHRQRRDKFLAAAKDLCLQIEAAPDVSTRKHLGSILNEQLAQEIRRTLPSSKKATDLVEQLGDLFQLVMSPSLTRRPN